MKYMDHYETIGDLITLLGDFPLPQGEVTREGDTFRYLSDTLEVCAVFEKHPSGAVRRCDTVWNRSDRAVTIRTALSKFVFNSSAYEVYTQYNENNDEGQGNWQPLVTEVAVRGRDLRCSFENAPFMALWNQANRRGMAFHVMECCLWNMRARKVIRQKGQKKTVTVEAGVDNSNFSLVLQPGQAFTLPSILCYSFQNSADMDAYKLHRYCNDTYKSKPLPVIYNSWMSRFDDIDFEFLSRQLLAAEKLGVEYFVIDAGWFGAPYEWFSSVGDWRESEKSGLEGRMEEFANLVRQKGLKFGLWFEIERAALTSMAYNTHPEYYFVEGKNAFLDFSLPSARQYALDIVCENVRKYGIEYIKFDFNATATFDAKSASFLPYFAGYREFIGKIRETFPDMILEGCASGGMRIAPATLEFFDCYWLSDQQNLHHQLDIFTSVVKRMPPRALTKWITIQSLPDFGPCTKGGTTDMVISGDGTWGYFDRTDPAYVLAAMLGGPVGISCDLTKLTDEMLEKMRAQIAAFKKERTFWDGCECHVLMDNEAMMVLQYNDLCFDTIKIQLFAKQFKQNAVTVYPVTAANATYRLEDGGVFTADMLQDGIEIPVGRRFSAVCRELKKQDIL